MYDDVLPQNSEAGTEICMLECTYVCWYVYTHEAALPILFSIHEHTNIHVRNTMNEKWRTMYVCWHVYTHEAALRA